MPHKNHRLLDAHTLLRAQPVVFGHEHPSKKVAGRKRHLLVDTEGLVMRVKVHAANVFDRVTG